MQTRLLRNFRVVDAGVSARCWAIAQLDSRRATSPARLGSISVGMAATPSLLRHLLPEKFPQSPRLHRRHRLMYEFCANTCPFPHTGKLV